MDQPSSARRARTLPVNAFADEWGATRLAQGKQVWFRLDATNWSHRIACRWHTASVDHVRLESGCYAQAISGPWDHPHCPLSELDRSRAGATLCPHGSWWERLVEGCASGGQSRVMRLRGGNHEHTATLRRPVALHPRNPTHEGGSAVPPGRLRWSGRAGSPIARTISAAALGLRREDTAASWIGTGSATPRLVPCRCPVTSGRGSRWVARPGCGR